MIDLERPVDINAVQMAKMTFKAADKNARRVCVLTSSPCRTINLESERIKEFAVLNGSILTDSIGLADMVIVNTCSNRIERLNDSLSLIKKAKKEKRRDSTLIVCGCLPAINKKKLTPVFKGISFGPSSYDRFDKIFNPKIRFKETGRSYPIDKRTFYVPICDGCIWDCSFCVIKKARGGNLKSRSIDEILCDIKKGLEKGYKTIELQGEDVGSWGFDTGSSLPELLEKITGIRKNFKINIFRVNPYWLIRHFAKFKKILHSKKIAILSLPIQSGSDKILKRMNRKYRIKDVRERLKFIRRMFPHIVLYTDMIIGFPGENSADFAKSIDLIREINFDCVSPYRFTRWKNCAAHKCSDYISDAVIGKRHRRLFNEALLSSKLAALNRKGKFPLRRQNRI